MGSNRLSDSSESPLDPFWSALPAQPSEQRARGILGAIAARIACVHGLEPPAALAELVPHDDAISAVIEAIPEDECTPDLLGATWEFMMKAADRRSHGAHFTPRLVADQVVGLALEHGDPNAWGSGPTVWDPTAGGGAFLLAAARHLEQRTGTDRGLIVRRMYASDIDPVSLSVCDAALELWAGDGTRPRCRRADVLIETADGWPSAFDVIVGNPPFLGQLTRDTGRTPERRTRLREVFGDLASGYVDEALLVVHVAVTSAQPGGVIALLLPESMLGVRDGDAVRRSVMSMASMPALWVDAAKSFAASVEVVAPILVRGPDRPPKTRVVVGRDTLGVFPAPADSTWAPLLAHVRGVPVVSDVSAGQSIGELAHITAGFRQHFYGIGDAVDDSTGPHNGVAPHRPDSYPLVTSGAIDPLHLLWGRRRVRYAGRPWEAPELTISRIADDRVRTWFEERRTPKLLLATQSQVIEAVVDPAGTLMPSVPVISVEPRAPEMLWLIAASISSPFASAWIARRAAGTGLSRSAIRVRAKELGRLPVPTNRSAWEAGAAAAAAAQAASDAGDDAGYVSAMRGLADSMNLAYGGGNQAASEWWWERLRLPEQFAGEAY